MKKFLVIIAMCCAWALIMTSGALHYYKLGDIPYGFHVDEMCEGVLIGCMVTEGIDAHRIPKPLFGDMHYGTPKPPTFVYPAMLWAKFFGFSVASLRTYVVTVHLIGLLGLFFLSRLLFGFRYATIVLLVASVSPWIWVMSRVAFESLGAVTFLVWGMYFALRSTQVWHWALAGAFFSAAMYTYPPMRMQLPIFLCLFIPYAFHRLGFRLRSLAVLVLVLSVLSIPLVQGTLNGKLQQRFSGISIFSKDYLSSIGKSSTIKDLAGIFLHNFKEHFNASFLFLTGDPSRIHSTGHHGILGWLDVMALVLGCVFILLLLVRKYGQNPLIKERIFLIFLCLNVLIGIAPAALTTTELPNALRIVGAWPFMCLLVGFLLWQACERLWLMWPVIVLTALLFANSFFNVYFKVYPKESKGMFNFWTLDEANKAKTEEDWLRFMVRYRHDDYHARYFLMQYRHFSCSESKSMWDNLRTLLTSQGVD